MAGIESSSCINILKPKRLHLCSALLFVVKAPLGAFGNTFTECSSLNHPCSARTRTSFIELNANLRLSTTWKWIGALFSLVWVFGSFNIALLWGLLFKQKCSFSLKSLLTLLHSSLAHDLCVFVSNIAAANACVVYRWLLGSAWM